MYAKQAGMIREHVMNSTLEICQYPCLCSSTHHPMSAKRSVVSTLSCWCKADRGANIMLLNRVIMLCSDARIISLLCSTKQVIMLHK